MIWDCFIFSNELDLLDLRLHVHGPYVDRFVLVESTHTFRGVAKRPIYYENKGLFEKFNSRIVHVLVDKPPHANPWHNEEFQRNAIKQGLLGVSDNDTIYLSDVDELADFSKFAVGPGEYLGIWMPFYYYYLNVVMPGAEWSSNAFCKTRLTQDNGDLNRIRHNDRDRRIVLNAGWHFSFMGGPGRVKEKIQSFSHSEFDRPELTSVDLIESRIKAGQDVLQRADPFRLEKVEITEATHPEYLVKNQEKYKHLILQ